jgi:hypothetical protein
MALNQTDIDAVIGLEFTHPTSYECYGAIEPLNRKIGPHPAIASGYVPFAEDGCGNTYVQAPDGSIGFWDHETYLVSPLTNTWEEFASWCFAPEAKDGP